MTLLSSHTTETRCKKKTRLAKTSADVGLKINLMKTELIKINTTAQTPITVNGKAIREVESFTYLGGVVDGLGGSDCDIKSRIGKARTAFIMLKIILASKDICISTKLQIFNSNVKSVFLYGSETWRTTKASMQKLQLFHKKITNNDLWRIAGQ